MDKLTSQDLALFVGQEVQTPDGVGKLFSVGSLICTVTVRGKGWKYIIEEITPICRRMEDMTEEEKEGHIAQADIGLDKLRRKWDSIKYLTSKGICPFQIWIDEGLVKISKPTK